MIELERVSHCYGDLVAVDDVSLGFARGTITVLVGTSGSGKSTLLRMINRLVVPVRGTVRIEGVDTATLPVQTLRRGIGYVIQGNGLFPHWSVARNVATVPRLLGWPAARIAARVQELLTLLNLDPDVYAHKLPHQLSGGQQQRVGVARALAAQPAILLMDEPFGALDPVIRAHAQDELLALQRRLAITVVLVSHDMDEALRLGDQIVVMDAGRILQAGAPAHILAHPAPGLVEQLVSGWGDRPFRLLALSRVGDIAQAGLGDEPVDGSAGGLTDNPVNNLVNGSGDNLVNNPVNGLADGLGNGFNGFNGLVKGFVNGSVNDPANDSANGSVDDLAHDSSDDLADGLVGGRVNGPADSLVNSLANDPANGAMNGSTDGLLDRLIDGASTRPADGLSRDNDNGPLPASASLREAMTQMLWRGVDRLAVADADGVARRHVTLAAIIARARAPQ